MKYLFTYLAVMLLSTGIASCQQLKSTFTYPKIRPVDISESYHGQAVVDRYRNLENKNDSSVKQWFGAQKQLFDSVMGSIPNRDKLKKELEEYLYSSNVRGGFPIAANGRRFFTRIYVKEKIQELTLADSLTSKEEVLFSTEKVNNNNEIFNIDYFEPSLDGKYIAFGISSNGGEMTFMQIVDVEKKTLLPYKIERVTYGKPLWIPSKEAFFYMQFKEVKTKEDANTKFQNAKVKIHFVGKNPNDDREIFSENVVEGVPISGIDFPFVYAFPGCKNVISSIYHGSGNVMSIHYTGLGKIVDAKLVTKTAWKTAFNFEDRVKSFGFYKDRLFVLGFKSNPNGSLLIYDIKGQKLLPNPLIEGKDEVLDDLMQVRNFLYLKKTKSGNCKILKINLDDLSIEELALPFSGYVYIRPALNGISPVYSNSANFFFSIMAWNKELAVYEYDPKTKEVKKTNYRPQGKYGNLSNIEVKEIEIKSHDGVLVPLTVMYLKGTQLNGKNPLLMEGYGAYGFSLNAYFDLSRFALLNRGGIYAVAHIRGGGEKGDDWYKAGYKKTKSNSWKDFIACAEYLIANKYTSAEKMAIKGSSAGAIAIGRAITERPGLFKAAFINVGVLNTLRVENSQNAASVPEYGSINNADEFKSLIEMDTYYHIKNGVQYPSLMIVGGKNDVRVDISQAAKAVARFQEASEGRKNPVLFKISDYGHNGTDELTDGLDLYSFILWQLNVGDSN